MEIEKKEVIRSTFYLNDILDIFEYGEATFGEKAALYFYEDLKLRVRNLETQYLLHPECRHLETKTKIYRLKYLRYCSFCLFWIFFRFVWSPKFLISWLVVSACPCCYTFIRSLHHWRNQQRCQSHGDNTHYLAIW